MPRVHVDLTDTTPRAMAHRIVALRPGELTALLHHDTPVPRSDIPIGGRIVPLEERRWAIARGWGSGVTWRIADEEVLGSLGHPAWLWTDDFWFDTQVPDGEAGTAPVALPLRQQMRRANALAGSKRRTVKTLSACIRELRKGTAPVAVVVSRDQLMSASRPGIWFCLAVLTCLPPDRRESLRVSTFEPNPDPQRWDLVLTASEPPDSFSVIHADDPGDEGSDLVAYFIRNRLHASDYEAIEAAAFYREGDGPDPWGDGVKRHLRSGVPGLTTLAGEMLELDPEGSVRAVVARLRAGAPVDGDVAKQIAAVTSRTSDPRPWRALVARSANERARAVQAWLPNARHVKPRLELLRIISALYPRGAPIKQWVETLLHWFRQGVAEETVLELLQKSLLENATPEASLIRASVWSEVVLTLTRRNPGGAVDAVLSPVGLSLADDGLSRVLVHMWASIPSRHRPLDSLRDFLEVLSDSEDGDHAARLLYLHLFAMRAHSRVDSMLEHWHALRERGRVFEDDALLKTLDESERTGDWLRAVAASVSIDKVKQAVMPWMRGEADLRWVEAESGHGIRLAAAPRERFVALQHLFPEGIVALEPLGRNIAADAIAQCRFPDPGLCEVATSFTEVPVASALWMWVAIASAPPLHFDDETIDATVVAFCELPPDGEVDRMTALRAAMALGSAQGWEPLDHARWLVRLCLAPEGEGDRRGFNYELALGVAQGLAERSDGDERMAEITHALCQLPGDHPALDVFLEYLVPNAWPSRPPRGYTRRVQDGAFSHDVRQRWRKAVNL